MESTSALPTEEDLSKLLTAEQYSDLFCSVDVLPEDPGSHVRVADKLSSNEERDRLLARRNQRPGVRGNSLWSQSVPVTLCRQSPSCMRIFGAGHELKP